mgnify:FL=1
MSEYMFGVGVGRVSRFRGRRADAIARKHGASYAGNPMIPGTGYQYWFTCPNHGHPFNEQTEHAVMNELREAGLFPLSQERR